MRKSITIQIFILLLLTHSSLAQISIPSATIISENFNLIGSSGTATLPLNWKMSSAGTGGTSGWATGTNITGTTQAASSGSPTTGGAYNWATTAGTDRAIGFMTDGSYASPNSVMAFYRNTTGSTVTTITVLFAIERYRVNTSTSSLSFFSSTDGSAWTARAAGDISAGVFTTGASTYNFTSPQTIYKTVTITGLSIANNGDFYLRWVFTNTGSTNSQGLALDDVSLFAGTATPGIIAKLRDLLTIDNPPINQVNPGDQLTYRTTIKNTGTGDANAVNLSIPAPTNTTLVGGSVKTSALAKDDSYATPFNTALTGNNIITNDFGLPSVTVISFGPVKNAAATAAGGNGSSDNGATVVVNPDGTFSYTPPSGFIGIDKFAYIITTGNAPDNDAIVTISVGTAPSVTNDSYTAIGNMQINPTGTSNLLNNDAGTGIQIVAVNSNPANVGNTFTTANGSNLTVSANGDFIYNPGPGFDGPESFTYTIDNGFSSPQTATVNITISGMVWFINAAAAAGGDGRLSAPFHTIAAYNAAAGANPPAANDNIFVYENPVPYSGSFTLLNGQRLIGQDASASLSTITGLTPAAYSSAFPVMNTGGPVTTLITTLAATNAVNLGSGNLLRGFTLGNTTGSGINGTGFGTLVIAEVSKNGTGQAVVLTTGAFGSPATIDNITTTSSVNAVSLAGCTGTLTISTGAISGSTGSAFTINGGTCSVIYSGGITQANNAAMVSISGGHATGTITFQTGTLSATNGTGLQFDNADGIYNFNGTTTLNGGDAGIDILNGSGGTFNFANGTSITGPTGTAFNIGGTANTCGVIYSGTITKNNAGTMVSIANHATGTVLFQTGILNATTAATGNGLQFDNADGIYNFTGTTTLNGGDAGIDILNGSAGVFTFGTGTTITSPSGVAFNIGGTASTCTVTYSGGITQANNAAMVSVSGGHTTGIVTFQTGTLSATNGTGLQFDNADGNYNFNGTTTLNGGDAGIDIINGSGGNFSFNNAPITNPTGVAFLVSGGNGSVGHSGAISKTSAGRLIDIQSRTGGSVIINGNLSSTTSSTGINVSNCTGGTITFAGATKTMNTPGSNPVNLATNTGTIINFTGGGLAITSTTATGFNATGGGTISVQGTGNIITSTAGTALNVVNTTIGAGGIIFQSITKNGGVNGIFLNNTGAGGLTISGTGAANSGGSIQNTSSDGITLINANNISLSDLLINTCGGNWIEATTVTGLTLVRINADLSTDHGLRGNSLTNLTIQGGTFDRGGAGNASANFHGIYITNLLGTSTVTGATFRRSNTIQFRVENTTATNFAGSPDILTVSGTNWNTHNSPFSGDHLSVDANTGGNFRLIMNSTTGINYVNEGGTAPTGGGIGVQATSSGTNGKMDISVTGLKTTSNTAGVVIVLSGGGTITYNIFGNKASNGTGFSSTGSGAIFVTHASAGGTSSGTINDNSINHTAGPATNALQVIIEGVGSSGGTGTCTISNNNINGNFQRGIHAQTRVGTSTLNLTVNNNSLTGTDPAGLQGINIETGASGTGHGNSICLNMFSNNVTVASGLAYRLRNGTTSSSCTITPCNFRLQNFSGSGSSTADIMNWVTVVKGNIGSSVSVSANYPYAASVGNCQIP